MAMNSLIRGESPAAIAEVHAHVNRKAQVKMRMRVNRALRPTINDLAWRELMDTSGIEDRLRVD
jgi:hypothetical protein